MPQTTLYDRTGKNVGSVELADALFAAPVNPAVLHQVATAQLAGRRAGTHDTKTRGEVRGGGISRIARRGPAAPARAPGPPPTTAAAARSSGRTRGATSSACRGR